MSANVGATRNRTDVFLKYRNQARSGSRPLGTGLPGSPSKASDKGTSKLLEAALASTSQDGLNQAELGTVGAASLIPPQYVDFKEQIRTEMFTIKQKMNELRASHGKATLTSFDDTNSQEVEIEVLTQDITRLFRKCEVRLTRFGEGGAASEADEKVKLNVQRTLAIELQRLSVQFRKQQKAYLNRLRQKNGPSASGASFSVLDEQGSQSTQQALDPELDPGFSEIQAANYLLNIWHHLKLDKCLTEMNNVMQTMKVDTMELLADERDKEVRNILQSINDLAQIMKDLSVLVIDQGTILDRIDYNMEMVSTKIEQGVTQLVAAEKTQKQSRTILCIVFLLVMVIFMLFIVVFKAIFF